MDTSHIINSLAEDRELYYQAASPPIVQSSNFCFNTVTEMRESLQHEDESYFYTRGNNPTIEIVRKKMAALEKTEDALLFASGSAAIGAAVMANVRQGDHIISVKKPYSWSSTLFNELLPRFGVNTTMVEGDKVENFQEALQPTTRMIFLETPNSWTFEMQDVKAIAQWAHAHNLLVLVDNSYASPINYNPAEDGADIILHSATKYLSGHSDTVAGVLCASKNMVSKIFKSEFMTLGGVISPMNAWLLLRGMRTLPIRMEKAEKTTAALIDYMDSHPDVDRIFYPQHSSHPQYALAQKYLKRGTGQFSITLKTEDPIKIEAFCNALQYFIMACSWGGYESLIFPAIVLQSSQNYNKATFPINMIRFYAGLEEPELLIEDLNKAFAAMHAVR